MERVTEIQTVDTYMQLVDRAQVARLKQHHHTDPLYKAAARDQAEALAETAQTYLMDCLRGRRVPEVQQHLRFHDHHDVEQEDVPRPTSVVDAASMLAITHATYWGLQTEIQAVKKQLDARKQKSALQARFVDLQRRIDLMNQLRNDLIEAGDNLLVDMCKALRGDDNA